MGDWARTVECDQRQLGRDDRICLPGQRTQDTSSGMKAWRPSPPRRPPVRPSGPHRPLPPLLSGCDLLCPPWTPRCSWPPILRGAARWLQGGPSTDQKDSTWPLCHCLLAHDPPFSLFLGASRLSQCANSLVCVGAKEDAIKPA